MLLKNKKLNILLLTISSSLIFGCNSMASRNTTKNIPTSGIFKIQRTRKLIDDKDKKEGAGVLKTDICKVEPIPIDLGENCSCKINLGLSKEEGGATDDEETQGSTIKGMIKSPRKQNLREGVDESCFSSSDEELDECEQKKYINSENNSSVELVLTRDKFHYEEEDLEETINQLGETRHKEIKIMRDYLDNMPKQQVFFLRDGNGNYRHTDLFACNEEIETIPKSKAFKKEIKNISTEKKLNIKIVAMDSDDLACYWQTLRTPKENLKSFLKNVEKLRAVYFNFDENKNEVKDMAATFECQGTQIPGTSNRIFEYTVNVLGKDEVDVKPDKSGYICPEKTYFVKLYDENSGREVAIVKHEVY